MSEPRELTEIGETADPVKVQRARVKDKLRLEREDSDVRHVMSTSAGRRFVAMLLRDSKFGSVGLRADDRMTLFALGELNAAHRLVSRLRRICLPLLRQMEDEEESN